MTPPSSNATPPCPFCAISTAYPPSSPGDPSTLPSFSSSSSPLLPSPYPTSTSTPTPTTTSTSTSTSTTTPTAPAHLILSTPHCLAFLDHAPLARGHTLLCVRAHRIKACDLRTAEGASLGRWLGVLGRAVTVAVGGVIAAEQGAKHEAAHENPGVGTKGEIDEEEGEEEEGEEKGVGDWNIVQNNGVRAAQVVPHVHYHIIPRVGGSGAPDVAKVKSWTVFGKGQREELDEADAGVLVGRIRESVGREVERVRRREGEGSVRLLFGEAEEEVGVGMGVEGWERRWSKL